MEVDQAAITTTVIAIRNNYSTFCVGDCTDMNKIWCWEEEVEWENENIRIKIVWQLLQSVLEIAVLLCQDR